MLTPNGLARSATARPIAPKPAIPIVLPVSEPSGPIFHCSRLRGRMSWIRFSKPRIAARTYSAIGSAEMPRPTVTTGPSSSHAGKKSTPVEAVWIQRRPNGQPAGFSAGALCQPTSGRVSSTSASGATSQGARSAG